MDLIGLEELDDTNNNRSQEDEKPYIKADLMNGLIGSVYFKFFDLTFPVYTIKKHNSNAQKIIASAMLLVNGVKSQAG